MCAPVLGGCYKFDSDTLKDYGRIEISLDHGATWLNALSDTVIPDGAWVGAKPILTGRIHQWRVFHAILWNYGMIDTLYYRYTFISDSIQTNQEGWMLDNLALIDHTEGVKDIESLDEISIFPNPTHGTICINCKNGNGQLDVTVYNLQGQIVHEQKIFKNNRNINISKLDNGIYMVKVLSRKNYCAKLIIKD